MAIFLILAPYGAYTFLMLVTSATSSVFAASAICLATITVDVVRGRSVKILAMGSAIVFAAIGLYLALIDPKLGTLGVKLSVDIGIFVISLGSMLVAFDTSVLVAATLTHHQFNARAWRGSKRPN